MGEVYGEDDDEDDEDEDEESDSRDLRTGSTSVAVAESTGGGVPSFSRSDGWEPLLGFVVATLTLDFAFAFGAFRTVFLGDFCKRAEGAYL
jgi:hypothetical protein